MKLKKSTLYIGLYFVMVIVHFAIWHYFVQDFGTIFYKYYLFLSFLFIFVLTLLTLSHRLYPGFTGFVFLGLIFVKLSMIFILLNQMKFASIPQFQFHFITPYLISLVLETLFAVNLLKDEKNQ